jgi:hypothetical protein
LSIKNPLPAVGVIIAPLIICAFEQCQICSGVFANLMKFEARKFILFVLNRGVRSETPRGSDTIIQHQQRQR